MPRTLLCVFALLATASALAQPAHSPFRDAEDGYFDLSEWLVDRKGFLPVPIIITEPAVGYGGGLALLYFRESLREHSKVRGATGQMTPPDIYAVAAAATENGTKFGGAGAMVSFREDRFRYRGGIAYLSPNLDFYGVGGALGGEARAVSYNLEGWATVHHAMFRLGDSAFWVVPRWNYFDLKSRFDLGTDVTGLEPRELTSTSSGLGISLEYDSRDNFFTPSRGGWINLDLTFYDPNWGSDTRFEAYRAKVFYYIPVSDALVVGLRADGRAARGTVPFYQLPFIDLRGIPAARYQDENTGVIETEVRWNVTPRWALIGFLGAARAWGRRAGFDGSPTHVGKGVGFRYLLAKKLGLYVGMDYGRGPEENAVYLQVGSGWR